MVQPYHSTGQFLGLVTVFGDTRYNIGLVLIVGAVAVSCFVAYRHWVEMTEEIDPVSPDELRESFQEAHAMGEMDEEEYARVMKRLGREKDKPGGDENRKISTRR